MNIDLGQKSDFPESVTVAAPAPKDKVHYPSIYLCGGSELKAIPESGTITFRYERVSQSQSERDDKKTCSVELECHEIIDLKPDDGAASVSDKSRGDLLDALKDAMAGKTGDEEEGGEGDY